MLQREFISAKCRITLRTVESIYRAVRWAVDRNRDFSIITNHLDLGWSLDLDILPEDDYEKLVEIFNNEPKTESQI